MRIEPSKSLRCAVYTRKSTEHGLDQEFNSLDAQREACEAYIKSQASQGWKLIPQHYDDPAYSGGNLERPALKRLLREVELGRIDVIVVYKIDRLTRSLMDFAKLVETFDARSVSFVAVTQQFNTTTSMGRLTLNILLSFAQFERELASERVRDKVAASRRKGKWTGGTVPLGYSAEDKKLVINRAEAQAVRTIYQLYVELRSFSRLVAELDRQHIVTKRRDVKVAKYRGGIPFTYGPLAYLLKNRVYLGEVHHGGKWFKGEHPAILDTDTFDRVQKLLNENNIRRGTKFSVSGALLKGKLFDDKGNRMSPTFSSKNGVRYRFYVSTALRGRKETAGSVTRVSAPEIEALVEAEVGKAIAAGNVATGQMFEQVHRVNVASSTIHITLAGTRGADHLIEIQWSSKPTHYTQINVDRPNPENDPKLIKAIVRARRWLDDLTNGRHVSIEKLADASGYNPKVIRQGLRLAFLPPAIVEAAISGETPVRLKQVPKLLPLGWAEQQALLSS